ncbi:MAG: hypothetical protein B7X34_07505 [Acidobacteriia bacterium 12-62-4]|nr:MAG: hypothetical protein B7X34_07505 [Acidobacteriia bacterium 12-62-4]
MASLARVCQLSSPQYGEVAVEEALQAGDEQGDLFLGVLNGRSAGGDQAVWSLGRDGLEAAD